MIQKIVMEDIDRGSQIDTAVIITIDVFKFTHVVGTTTVTVEMENKGEYVVVDEAFAFLDGARRIGYMNFVDAWLDKHVEIRPVEANKKVLDNIEHTANEFVKKLNCTLRANRHF